jgi:hypothetical protein
LIWGLFGGGTLLEDFVDQLRIVANRRSSENRPRILLQMQERSLPLLDDNNAQPTLIILPFSSLGSAPRLARSLEIHNNEGEEMDRVCQDLLDELVRYFGIDGSPEDEKIWRYNMDMKMRRARSIWGNGGLLNDDAGLFTRESETIRGSGFRDQFCFYEGEERFVLGEATYTRFPAPPLHEFEAGGEQERPLFNTLLDYVQLAIQSGHRPISLVYVHINNALEEFPHGFIKGVASRLLDFGQHAHSMNADLLVLSTAGSVQELNPNIRAREKNFLKRRLPNQRFFIAAQPDDFAKHFPLSEFGKQWAMDFKPISTNVQFSENTQYSDQPSAVAVFSPVGIGAYRRSREIRQEQINTLRE